MTAPEDSASALARLRQEMEGPPFHGLLRPEAASADPTTGEVVIRLPFRADLRRSRHESFFHGGVVAALVDLAGHAAIAVAIGRTVPTVDLRIDYLRPAGGDALLATGARRVGRSVGVADIEITGGDGRTVALGRGVFSTRPPGLD
jgi:uncharacterized protein (TIGR00369 family)